MKLIHPTIPQKKLDNVCCNCKEYSEDMDYQDRGEPLCNICYNKCYFTCEACDEVLHNDHCQEDSMCNTCYWEDHFCCRNCDETYHTDYGHSTENSDTYCETCFDEIYVSCEDCLDYIDRENSAYIDNYGYLCDGCLESADLSECKDCGGRRLSDDMINGLCNYCRSSIKRKLIHPLIKI